jgi:hypothetical protein
MQEDLLAALPRGHLVHGHEHSTDGPMLVAAARLSRRVAGAVEGHLPAGVEYLFHRHAALPVYYLGTVYEVAPGTTRNMTCLAVPLSILAITAGLQALADGHKRRLKDPGDDINRPGLLGPARSPPASIA